MTPFWKTIYTGLLSAAAISAAIAWMLETSIEKYIDYASDKQIERVKHVFSEELESYKSLLETESAANKTRFDKTLNFRAQQLSEFYWPIYIRFQIDTAVYKNVVGAPEDRVPDDVRVPMEKFILDNHGEIVKIIEEKFYLSEVDSKLNGELLDYVKHVAVYKSMRTTPAYDNKVPINLHAPFPPELIKDFKERLDVLQAEYNLLLQQAHMTTLDARQNLSEPIKN